MSYFIKTDFRGDTNIGLYGFATDKYCFIGIHDKKIHHKIKNILKVKVVASTIFNTEFVSIFCAGTSDKIILPEITQEYELDELSKKFDVLVVKTRETALGNLVVMNDSGIILSPILKNFKKEIEGFFGLRSVTMRIAGTNVIGKAAVATNKGCLLHSRAAKNEIKKVEDALGVRADIGTVSYGSSFVGSGLIANSHGFVASSTTSGPELGRITEALGFL
jgi:translation initiation factor 6